MENVLDISVRRLCEKVQNTMNSIHAPVDIGRIPIKIETGFSGFTADQFKNWVNLYSIVCLHGVIANDDRGILLLPVEFSHNVHLQNMIIIDVADALLFQFCRRVQRMYGSDVITPNMHMHCHLKRVLLDYGPVFGFWLPSNERYNGILEHQSTSNRCIETQLMRRFLQDNLSHAFKPPSEYQSELGSLCNLQQKVTGSLLLVETGSHLTQTWSLEFPTYHTLYKLSFNEQQAVMKVLLNVQLLDSFKVNVLSCRYKYVRINGMKVASSTSKHSVVVMAHKNSHVANRESVAIPPNTLQACKVNYFLKVTYSIDGCNFSSEFASVS